MEIWKSSLESLTAKIVYLADKNIKFDTWYIKNYHVSNFDL